jgi:hypothetical protein
MPAAQAELRPDSGCVGTCFVSFRAVAGGSQSSWDLFWDWSWDWSWDIGPAASAHGGEPRWVSVT